MKISHKLLIISSTLIYFSLNFLLADDITDCYKFWALSYKDKWSFEIVDIVRETEQNKYTKFLTIDQQRNILKKDDLNTSILNLKKYCCENGKWNLWVDTCEKDKPYFNDNALDSPYLFDHIFDVIMRRLNGLNWEKNIYTKTKMSLDDKWEERRKRIDKEAKSVSGSTPQTIITKYQQIWKQSPSSLWYNITQKIYGAFWNENSTFLSYVSWSWNSEESKQIAEAFKNYDKWTLYDRYINAWALSEYFYALLWAPDKGKRDTIARLKDKNWSWILQCDNIIAKQIDWEKNYVTLVTQRASNLFLFNFIEWYFSYLYERQQKLQKLRKDSSDRWLDVTREIECLQNVCTQSW